MKFYRITCRRSEKLHSRSTIALEFHSIKQGRTELERCSSVYFKSRIESPIEIGGIVASHRIEIELLLTEKPEPDEILFQFLIFDHSLFESLSPLSTNEFDRYGSVQIFGGITRAQQETEEMVFDDLTPTIIFITVCKLISW